MDDYAPDNAPAAEIADWTQPMPDDSASAASLPVPALDQVPDAPARLPAQADAAYANAMGSAQNQQASAEKKTAVIKADDLRRRGLAFYTTPTGPQTINDASGSALTDFDAKTATGYDSAGQPQRVKFNANTGAPELHDPYDIPDFTDQKTGNVYKAPPDLPWKQVGVDPVVAKQIQDKKSDTLDKEADTLLSYPISLAKGQAVLAANNVRKSAKATAQQLQGLGVQTTDPATGAPTLDLLNGEPADLHAHVESAFGQMLNAPEATAKPLWGGSQFSTDAQQVRDDIARRKEAAQNALEAHLGTVAKANDANDALGQLQDQRQQIENARARRLNEQRVANGQPSLYLPGLDHPDAAPQSISSDLHSAQRDPATGSVTSPHSTGAEDSSQAATTATHKWLPDHSDKWNQMEQQAADEANAAGLPAVPVPPNESAARVRMIDAINRVEASGYKVPHFIGNSFEPAGDRSAAMDADNLVAALQRKQSDAQKAGDTTTAQAAAKEAAYWTTSGSAGKDGMSAAEWKAGTGENDPQYPAAEIARKPGGPAPAPFAPTEKPFRVAPDGSAAFDPARLVDGVTAAHQSGAIDDDTYSKLLPKATAAQQAIAEQQKLVETNPIAAKIKAGAVGLGRGGAFLAGSVPGARAGAALGALIPGLDATGIPEVAGGIIGGAITGGMAARSYDKVLKEMAQHSDTIKSFTDASQAYPNYDTAGNLISFVAGLPKAATDVAAKGLSALAGEGEGLAARGLRGAAQGYEKGVPGVAGSAKNLAEDWQNRVTQGASQPMASAATVARLGGFAAGNVAIDTAIKEGAKALGLGGDGQTLSGATQAGLIGSLLAGHGISFENIGNEQMADIMIRGKIREENGLSRRDSMSVADIAAKYPNADGVIVHALSRPLDARETEIYNAGAAQIKAALNQGENLEGAQVTAKQGLTAGQPYGNTSAVVTPAVESGGPSSAPPNGGTSPLLQTPSQSQPLAPGLPGSLSPSSPSVVSPTNSTISTTGSSPTPTPPQQPAQGQTTAAGSPVPSAEPASTTGQTTPAAPAPQAPAVGSPHVVSASQQPAPPAAQPQDDPRAELAQRQQELAQLPPTAPPWQRDVIAGRIRQLQAIIAETEAPHEPSPTQTPQVTPPTERSVAAPDASQPGVSPSPVATPAGAEGQLGNPWDHLPGIDEPLSTREPQHEPDSNQTPVSSAIAPKTEQTSPQGDAASPAPHSKPVEATGAATGGNAAPAPVARSTPHIPGLPERHAGPFAPEQGWGEIHPSNKGEQVETRNGLAGTLRSVSKKNVAIEDASGKYHAVPAAETRLAHVESTLSKPPEPSESTPSHEQNPAKTPKENASRDGSLDRQPAENEVRPRDGALDGNGNGQRSSGSGEVAKDGEPAGSEVRPHTLTDASSRIRKLARGRLKEEFARLQTELHEGDANSGMFVAVGGGERITFNPARVAAAMDVVRERGLDPDAWLSATVGEELIHTRQLTVGGPAFEKQYTGLWKSLPKSIRDLVASVYKTGGRDSQGNLVPHIMGAEYERMLAQYRETGTFSELLSGEEGADKLKAILDAPQNELIEHSIARVESLTSVPQIPGLEPWRNGVPGLEEKPSTLSTDPKIAKQEKQVSTLKGAAQALAATGSKHARKMAFVADKAAKKLAEMKGGAPKPSASPRAFKVRAPQDEHFAADPTVQAIGNHGGLLSKTGAQAKWSAEKWRENKGEWDDAPALSHPTHNSIYKPNGLQPDEMANALIEEGLLPAGAAPPELWKAIGKASESAARMRQQATAQKREQAEVTKQGKAFDQDALQPHEGLEKIPADSLQVGDVVAVSGEKLRVTDIDPETFAVTLEDHSKYGIQHVEDGQLIYGEVERAKQESEAPVVPKLQAGQDQGDLVTGGDENTGKTATITNEEAGTLARIGGQVVAKLRQAKSGQFVADLNEAGQKLQSSQKAEVNRAALAYTKTWQAAKVREGQRRSLAGGEMRSQSDMLDSNKAEDPLFQQRKSDEPKPEETTVTKKSGLQDFGEKLGGARKDMNLHANEPRLTPKGNKDNVTRDAITGAHTHLSSRAVDRATAQRISEANESRRRAVGKVVQELERRGAVRGAVRSEPGQASQDFSDALGQPLLNDAVRAKMLALPTLGIPGSEGIVTTDGQFAYKLYLTKSDAGGEGIGLVAQLKKSADGRLGLIYRRGTVEDILDKTSVLSHLGMPTEVQGIVGSTGEVITKQPVAEQTHSLARIVSEMHAMGARHVPIAGTNSHLGNWLVNVAGRHYIVTDIDGRNVKANNEGIPRPIDVVLAPVSEADFAAHPVLAEARKEVSPLEGDVLFANEPHAVSVSGEIDKAVSAARSKLDFARATRQDSGRFTIAENEDREPEDGRSWFTDWNPPEGEEWMKQFVALPSIDEADGKFYVGESHIAFDSLEKAFEAAKSDISESIEQQGGTHGSDMDGQEAARDVFGSFPQNIPGVEHGQWFHTKWGSWYLEGKFLEANGDPGEAFKLSIRDHDATRKEMGIPDKSFTVSKQWNPEEVGVALKDAVAWLEKKATAASGEESGGAGFKASEPGAPTRSEDVRMADRATTVTSLPAREKSGRRAAAVNSESKFLSEIGARRLRALNLIATKRALRPAEEQERTELRANEPHEDDTHHSRSRPRDESGNFVPDSTLGPEGPQDVEKMVRDYMDGRGKNRSETLAEKQARKDTMLSAENRLASKLGVEPKVEPTPAMRALAAEVAKHKEEKPDAVEQAKEVARGVVGKLKEIQRNLTELPQYGPVLRATNELQADLQRASKEAQDLHEAVVKKAPDALTREAITNWRQAGGDLALLSQWAGATEDPKLKAGYLAAAELSADHKALARDISAFYAEKLALGQQQEMLQEGVANYATQIWVDDSGRKLPTGGAGGFKQQFAYANPRQFDNFFEGEQLAEMAKALKQPSFKPLTKDAASLLGIYSAEFNKVLASRNYIRKLVDIKDADGRQVVAPSTMSKQIGTIKPGEKTDLTSGAFDVNREKGGNLSDYQLPANPAFQKWRFLEPQYKEDPEGLNPPVATGNKQLMIGNLVVHPNHFRFINNVLGESAIRKWLNEPSEGFLGAGKATISGILRANGFTKGLMFAGSPFHAIHVGKRALGSWVNPFSLGDEIDFSDPMQRWAIEHGLVVHGDRLGQQQFVEGLGTEPWLKKIPGIGPVLTAASDFTFHTYIPRMKLRTFAILLQRKMKTFAKELADGRVTVDQLGAKAAYETNNIFGHMNYSGMGRNKTVQQVLGMVVLAPDFTESTFRHYGDAFTKHGSEARRGLITLAIGTLVAAKIINALLDDGDPHLDHPFSVVVNNREYSLRSPITDLVHLYKDWWSFASGRESPFLRALIEFGSGKNWRGEPVTWKDAARDIVAQPLPMTIKALPGLRDISPTDSKSPIKGFEQFVSSLGLGIRRYSPSQDVHKLADDYLKAHGQQNPQTAYPQSKYANLKYALFDNQLPTAREEYQKLVAQQGEKKVADGFHSSLFHPVMANKVMLADFLKTLTPAQQKTYQAATHERDQAWQRFQGLCGTATAKPALAASNPGSRLFSFD